MFTLRKQLNSLIIEQKFCSESQAISAANKSWRAGSWHSVMVLSHELNIAIVELGTPPNDAFRRLYAEAI